MSFKSFIILWLSIIILATSLAIIRTRVSPGETTDLISETNHYSVVYQGFIPGYSTDFPDYYLCINDLKNDPLQMSIRLFIQNQEASGYYFRVEQHSTPPAGWTIYPYNIGFIAVDATLNFVYSGMYRALPSSIPAGELTETVNLDVKAYVDAGYTNLYSADNFTVTYHLIDRASSSWTVIEHNNFDDATNQGWVGGSITTTYYRSFRYSLVSGSSYSSWSYWKTFNLIGYSKVYLICPIRVQSSLGECAVSIDGTLYFHSDVTVSGGVWYSYTVPLPVSPNPTPLVRIDGGVTSSAYMDDVYVIGQ